MNKNFEQFKRDFKRDLLVKIVINMKHGKMSRSRSQQLAKHVLKIYQETQAKKVFEQINKLAESHPDILDIFIKRMEEFDKRYIDKEIEQIHIYLKN